MFPPGFCIHLVPVNGPSEWCRPNKVAEPGWLRRKQDESDRNTNSDKPQKQEDKCSSDEKSHIYTSTQQWECYAGVPNSFYGQKLRLSRTMIRDHCQYTYDAVIEKLCEQIQGQ